MVITFTSEVTGFWKLSDFFQQSSSNWKGKLGHTHGEEKFLFVFFFFFQTEYK